MQIRAHIPNLLTLGNLLCGSLAILFVFDGEIWTSCFLFGLSLVLDFLDGFLARMLNAYSEIGKQLDSLADLISFGLFPGLLVYKRLQEITPEGNEEYLSYLALLIPVFSAIRLAKFNLAASSTSFQGLPVPANALLLLSYVYIPIYQPNSILLGGLANPYFLMALIAISCFLLVAPFRLFSLKFADFSIHNNWHRYLLCVLGGIGISLFQFQAIPFIILFYLLLSFWLNP